ncbi:MAG: hypothetical protein KatS3mg085_628 [Candidatus Dojkabacteria bacterium]|nr:MAG: hypothetical protein KatS3mg085_628 [Candidatus Dojkabacteria bacterium]
MNNLTNFKNSKRMPDEATKNRIKNLAIVGLALNANASDVRAQTDYFLAKEALNKFKAGIDELDLDPESEKGMEQLIEYLSKKIDKRMQNRL